MKKFYLLFTFCFFLISLLSAQISEREKTMSVGLYNAMVLELPDTKKKFAENIWKKYLKQFRGKTRRNKKAKEYFTENGSFSGIGSGSTNMYSNLSASGNSTELSVWIDLGDEYLNSYAHPDQYTEAERLLMEFALEITREKIKIELDEEENRLKKLAKSLKKLERANDNYHRDIRVAEEKIKKAENNLKENEITQEETKSSIEQQKAAIDAVRKRLSDI